MEYISRSYYPVLALCMASVWNIRKQINKNDSVQDSQVSRQVCAREKRASAGPLQAFLCVMTLHAAGPEIERADKSKQSLRIKSAPPTLTWVHWRAGQEPHVSDSTEQYCIGSISMHRPFDSTVTAAIIIQHQAVLIWCRPPYHAILVVVIATTPTN